MTGAVLLAAAAAATGVYDVAFSLDATFDLHRVLAPAGGVAVAQGRTHVDGTVRGVRVRDGRVTGQVAGDARAGAGTALATTAADDGLRLTACAGARTSLLGGSAVYPTRAGGELVPWPLLSVLMTCTGTADARLVWGGRVGFDAVGLPLRIPAGAATAVLPVRHRAAPCPAASPDADACSYAVDGEVRVTRTGSAPRRAAQRRRTTRGRRP